MNPAMHNAHNAQQKARQEAQLAGRKTPLKRASRDFDLKPLKSIAYILLGVSAATLGLKGFVVPNGLVDGGAMGMALLSAKITGLPLAVLVFAINLPFMYMGWKQVGKWFALKTLVAIGILSVALAVVEVPNFTQDKLLIAVFGGMFLGAGIGFAIRGGAVIDGTEVLAIFLTRRLPATVGDMILVINVIIFSTAAAVFDLETALYSLLTYLAASKMVDFVTVGIEEYMGINIISPNHSEDIRIALTEHLGRGVTVYNGQRGLQRGQGEPDNHLNILLCIVTRLEMARVKHLIHDIDPSAFVFAYPIRETVGGRVKKRAFH